LAKWLGLPEVWQLPYATPSLEVAYSILRQPEDLQAFITNLRTLTSYSQNRDAAEIIRFLELENLI